MVEISWQGLERGNHLNCPFIPQSITCVKDSNDNLYLNVKDVAYALGVDQAKTCVNGQTYNYVRWERLGKYLASITGNAHAFKIGDCSFITEEEYYLLLMRLETQEARELKRIVFAEISKLVPTESRISIIARTLENI